MKKTNARVAGTYFKLKGNTDALIKSIGFNQVDKFHYHFQKEDLTLIKATSVYLTKILYDLKLAAMTANERDDFLFEENCKKGSGDQN